MPTVQGGGRAANVTHRMLPNPVTALQGWSGHLRCETGNDTEVITQFA